MRMSVIPFYHCLPYCPETGSDSGDLNLGRFDYTVIILTHGATSPAPVVNTVKML